MAKSPWIWRRRLPVLIWIAAVILEIWRGSLWYIACGIVVGLLVELTVARTVSCPSCRERLRARMPKDPYGHATRWFFDCARCRVTWDPHYREESSDTV
jgi:hypothetical protein